jgi:hypothetical protein
LETCQVFFFGDDLMWIQLKSIQYLSVNGRQTTHFPGEWVEVGGQLARSLITTGQAHRPDLPDLQAMPGCGIVVRAGGERRARKMWPGLEVMEGEPGLEFRRTLYWDTARPVRPELVSAGFGWLEQWEVAVPLGSYERLARDIGNEAERAKTAAVIRDLRVPFYETGLMFLRRCQRVEGLLAAWRAETGERRLAFLRALYRVKPLVLALPVEWVS